MIRQSEIEIIVSKCVEATIIAMSLRKDDEDFLTKLESGLREMMRDELTKAGAVVQRKRRAIVSIGTLSTLDAVRNYLPHNFSAYDSTGTIHGHVILIEGYDCAGWTLDAYVIPRLASGLIFAEEVSNGNV